MARIPQFKSNEEAAAFWDSHSLADFDEDLAPAVDVGFRPPHKQIVSLRLDAEDARLLELIARSKGLSLSTLARTWVKERLVQLSQAPKTAEE